MGVHVRFTWHDPDDFSAPVDRRLVLVNWWWPVNEQGYILFHERFGRVIPQGNTSKAVAEMIANTKAYRDLGCTGEVVQVPVVYIEHRCD